MEHKAVNTDFGELIDRLSILKIKESILGKDFTSNIEDIENDIDILIKENEIKFTPNIIRQIVLMSQSNLHVWMLKDDMQRDVSDEDYNDMLKKTQDFNNGIKNSIKNMIMSNSCNNKPKMKATFVDESEWYYPIIKNMEMKSNE